jgi:hypothetical protein
MKTSRQIYCQYLLSSQINYTCTNLADHTDGLDHNSVYRYLKGEHLRPALVWEKVKDLIVQTPEGYLLFDDTVLDKSYSFEIDGVRRQYSGNAHGVVKGIGIVNLVYYNAERDWCITTPNVTNTGSLTTASSTRSVMAKPSSRISTTCWIQFSGGASGFARC